jgi:hypothetical protein
MRKRLVFIIICSVGIAMHSHAQEMEARLIAYKGCHPDVNHLDLRSKPQQCNPASQSVTFMIQGQNIAVVDQASLELSRLEVKGEDLRFNRRGDKAYKLSLSPKIDEEGKHAVFNITMKSVPFGHIASTSLEGSIDILTSKQLIIKEQAGLDLAKSFSISVGPLSVSNQPAKKQPIPDTLSKVAQERMEKRTEERKAKEDEHLQIYVTGELDAFVGLEVYENGGELARSWMMLGPTERTLRFSKPVGSIIDIKVRYWDGLNRRTVPIKMSQLKGSEKSDAVY